MSNVNPKKPFLNPICIIEALTSGFFNPKNEIKKAGLRLHLRRITKFG
jgi:hypothetical protein